MQTEGASAGILASAHLLQNASHLRSEKSPVLASAQGNLGISAVAREMRRLFRPCGGVARQDVSAAAEADAGGVGACVCVCVCACVCVCVCVEKSPYLPPREYSGRRQTHPKVQKEL